MGPRVFRGQFCQILPASLQNSVAYCGKIVQIPLLTVVFHLWVNWALSHSETVAGQHSGIVQSYAS